MKDWSIAFFAALALVLMAVWTAKIIVEIFYG